MLVSSPDLGRPRYQGTAFPFLHPGVWVTAGHCVRQGCEPESLALLSTPPAGRAFYEVKKIRPHPTLDVALLWSEQRTATPFPELAQGAWGNEVSVVGYPEDLFIDTQGRDRPRARLLKGHIQRVEESGPEADGQGDFELSFACPGGLSGSPVVLQGGRQVVGVVIGNRDSAITEHSAEQVTADGNTTRVEIQRAISFGSAVDLARAAAWMRGQLGTT